MGGELVAGDVVTVGGELVDGDGVLGDGGFWDVVGWVTVLFLMIPGVATPPQGTLREPSIPYQPLHAH